MRGKVTTMTNPTNQAKASEGRKNKPEDEQKYAADRDPPAGGQRQAGSPREDVRQGDHQQGDHQHGGQRQQGADPAQRRDQKQAGGGTAVDDRDPSGHKPGQR
jgi:hypothetical protein